MQEVQAATARFPKVSSRVGGAGSGAYEHLVQNERGVELCAGGRAVRSGLTNNRRGGFSRLWARKKTTEVVTTALQQ